MAGRGRQAGFTLIEVMVAVLVMAVGLLGFALLQTMSVRYSQSANQRTHATNLAYDMLDQMRSNRLGAVEYRNATFTGGTDTACTRATGTVTVASNITRWQCQVRAALGVGSSATVTYAGGIATVTIVWGDQRWESNAARRTGAYETGTLTLSTRL
ncbi:type IV pilus modification protein PilV [Pseudoxanthomonas gei]|uniref:Type IV pilus modification protein PilV n=2 Tax=Pseudoxanthomonas gei TaxID=1383030 RepID=A0ABX0ACF8_9GAMM|nr:type IV pilus modification protein PilV [Pseudoxanthomonas gei]